MFYSILKALFEESSRQFIDKKNNAEYKKALKELMIAIKKVSQFN